MTQELLNLLRESFDYSMTNVHTSFPGVVVKYDAATRRADIQPSLKRMLPNGKFVDFPIIPDVPVVFAGTKKYTIHIKLEKNDEVDVRVCERSTDMWRDTGGKGIEDKDPRRFNLQDCYCTPGLQPIEFIGVEDDGLNIIHKTDFNGNFISSIAMNDDKIDIKYKEKAAVLIEEDHINAKTEKCSLNMTDQTIIMDNGKNNLKLDGVINFVCKAADLIKIGNTVDTLGNMISTLFQILIAMKTVGSPAQHVVSPDDITKFTQLMTTWKQVFN